MEKLIIPEQNIINAVCVYIARQNNVQPEQIEVELMYDDETSFTAEVFLNGQKQLLSTFNLIEAVRFSLNEFWNLDPLSTGIELLLDDVEGIIASIH